MLPRLRRQHQWEHFQAHYVPQQGDETDDQAELDVVEMGDEDVAGEVPFTFAIRAGWMAPFVEEEDEEDFSLLGTSGSGVHGSPPPWSVRQDIPLVMAMAAECVGLPLPLPLPPKPVSRLRQGFYGPVYGSQPSFHPHCHISGSVWRRRGDSR